MLKLTQLEKVRLSAGNAHEGKHKHTYQQSSILLHLPTQHVACNIILDLLNTVIDYQETD